MFVDIVKSTSFFQDYDQEDISDLLQNFLKKSKNIITRNYGFINQTMGDGFYAVFGFKRQNSDRQAFWACKAADEIQKHIDNLELRIGINSGYVTYTEKKEFSDLNYYFVGEAINTSSHICSKMEGEGIYVSEAIYQQVKTNFIVEKLEKRLFNKTNIYTLRGVIDYTNKFSSYSSNKNDFFIGREIEMHKILFYARKSFRNRSCGIHIQGKSGIGKTSFIFKFLEKIKNLSIYIFSYSWFPEECRESSVIDSFIDSILVNFSFYDLDDQRLKQFLLQTNKNKNFYLSIISERLNFKFLNDEWKSLKSEQKEYLKAEFISELILNLSVNNKIIVVFDDIQWTDSSCQILLKALYARLGKGNFFLLSSSHKHFSRHHIKPSNSIVLNEMNLQEVERIVTSETNFLNIPKYFLNKVSYITGNNPYYITQVARYIALNFSSFNDIEQNANIVPDTIDAVFLSKINCLNKDEKIVIQAASIIGDKFNFQNLEKILHYSSKELFYFVRKLESKNIIKKIKIFENVYSFAHVLEREAIYNGLPKKFKIKYHLKYLNFIEKGKKQDLENPYKNLSYHSFNANYFQKAYSYSFYAGKRAISLSMPGEAIEYYNVSIKSIQKLEATDRNKVRLFRAYIALSKAYCFDGNGKKAEEYILLAETLKKQLGIEKKDCIGQVLIDAKIPICWSLSNYSYKTILQFEADIKNNTKFEIATSIRLGCMLSDIGHFEESNDKLLNILKKSKIHENQELLFFTYASTLSDISRNYGELGEFFLARQYASEALFLINDLDFESQKIYPLAFSSSHFLREESFEKAFVLLEKAYVLSNSFNVGMVKPFVHGQYAYAKYHVEKKFENSEKILIDLISSIKEKKFHLRISLYQLYLAEIYYKEGYIRKAKDIVKEAIYFSKKTNSKATEAYLYYLFYLIASKIDVFLSGKLREPNYFLNISNNIAVQLNLKPLIKKTSMLLID